MDSDHPLVCCQITALPERVAAEPARAAELFEAAARAYQSVQVKDPDVESALAERDLARIAKIAEDWDRDRRVRPLEDRELLKKAMKAFRKRLKLTRLDDESRLGVGPMSKGGSSGIFGITPPTEYPAQVWKELARQGKLRAVSSGLYALVGE